MDHKHSGEQEQEEDKEEKKYVDSLLKNEIQVNDSRNSDYADLYCLHRMVFIIQRTLMLEKKNWGSLLQHFYFAEVQKLLHLAQNTWRVKSRHLTNWIRNPMRDYYQEQFFTRLCQRFPSALRLFENQNVFTFKVEVQQQQQQQQKKRKEKQVVPNEMEEAVDLGWNNDHEQPPQQQQQQVRVLSPLQQPQQQQQPVRVSLPLQQPQQQQQPVRVSSPLRQNVQQEQQQPQQRLYDAMDNKEDLKQEEKKKVLQEIYKIQKWLQEHFPDDRVLQQYKNVVLQEKQNEELKQMLLEWQGPRVQYLEDFKTNSETRKKLLQAETKDLKWCGNNNESDTWKDTHQLLNEPDHSANFKYLHFFAVYSDYQRNVPVGFVVVKELFHELLIKEHAQLLNYHFLYMLHKYKKRNGNIDMTEQQKKWSQYKVTLPNQVYELNYICSLKPGFHILHHFVTFVQSGNKPFENIACLLGVAEVTNRGQLSQLYAKNGFDIYFGHALVPSSYREANIAKLKTSMQVINNNYLQSDTRVQDKWNSLYEDNRDDVPHALQLLRSWILNMKKDRNTKFHVLMYSLPVLLTQSSEMIHKWLSKLNDQDTDAKQDVYFIWLKDRA